MMARAPQRRPWARSPARRALAPTAPPEALLAAIPSLPRHILGRLVARMIDHMDAIDGDADAEDGHDREEQDEREPCPAEGDGLGRLYGRMITA